MASANAGRTSLKSGQRFYDKNKGSMKTANLSFKNKQTGNSVSDLNIKATKIKKSVANKAKSRQLSFL